MKQQLLFLFFGLTITLASFSQVAGQVSDIIICDDNINDGLTFFDLSLIDAQILNGQNPNDFNISYHASQADADAFENVLSNPYQNIFNPQLIFARVTEISTGNFDTTSFLLIVNPAPVITQPSPFIVCDADGDGFTQFDLNSREAEILNGMTNVSISFHETLADAESDTNAIASPYSNVTNPQTVYARVGNFTGCFAISTLELQAIYCANVGQIVVDAFVDSNGNSVFDTTENNYANGYFTYEINNDGLTYTINSSSGHFLLFSENETDSYDITFNLYSSTQNCYSVPMNSIENVSVSAGNTLSVGFPVVAEESCEDLGVYLFNSSASPRPGFDYFNRISLQNLGNEPITSGTVEFMYDGLLQFSSVTSINSNYTVSTISGGISIDFVNLMPNEVENITISLYCPPSVTLGTVVTNEVIYTTAGPDINIANNTSTLSQTVIGSYDPNDIIESHGPKIVYDNFTASDEYLYYLIRFQNVGTAEAINIRIEDVLNSQLDTNTFEMLHSSHNNVVTRFNNELTWQFDNINLPSESMDADGSNGFVYFKIKPQAGYAIGDMIPNVADIYFDFNTAITTNTFNTEFVETLSVDDFQSSNFSVFPNPATRSVTLQFSLVMNGSITIFDIQGKTILNNSFSNENSVQLDVSAFERGLYFVKLNTGFNQTIKKLIIK